MNTANQQLKEASVDAGLVSETKSIITPGYTILKDAALNEQLVTNGFVVLPILNKEEIEVFAELYKKWHPDSPQEFYKSYFSKDQTYKTEVEEHIMNYCRPKLKQYFVDYEAFGAMFVVKPSGDKGHIPPHQDWSFVDETKHWSLNMWLPIQDVTERNGTMRFLAGSQFFLESVRGAGTPELYNHLYDAIEPYLVDVPLNAGEAVFFYHGIVHCSHFNDRSEERVCLGMSLLQKDAPVYFHYLKDGNNFADKFLVDTSFYVTYTHNRDKMPENTVYLGEDQRPFSRLTKQQLLDRIEQLKQSRL